MVCNPAAARAEYGIAPGRHFAGSFAGFPSVFSGPNDANDPNDLFAVSSGGVTEIFSL
jgi:hypothetical protein